MMTMINLDAITRIYPELETPEQDFNDQLPDYEIIWDIKQGLSQVEDEEKYFQKLIATEPVA